MKKTYREPSVAVAYIGTATVVCGSQGVSSSGAADDINYGGVDTEGTKDPASRRSHDVWEDEEEE
ncbi:MAG: hypothetical protein II826_09990 [Prevotella sp.]|nr:hypothetical protein [Prevotella sp.]MBR6320780.1 hypothetical protein [Prevotella sp.]